MIDRMKSNAKARVLIVDDHPAVREALALRVAQTADMEVCGEAGDTTAALRLSADLDPDVTITDISLKDSDGIDLIKRLRTRDDKARILVWSMHSESTYADRALRAGAMGYITKEQATDKIIDALRHILAGKIYLSQHMKERLLNRITDHKTDRDPVECLTDRELQVFRMIGNGVRTQDIADQMHLSIKTIETYRDRIKKKLDLQDATELIRSATLWVAGKPDATSNP